MFVSGGVERQLFVWRADSQCVVGELVGHVAPVAAVHCDDDTHQVVGGWVGGGVRGGGCMWAKVYVGVGVCGVGDTWGWGYMGGGYV